LQHIFKLKKELFLVGITLFYIGIVQAQERVENFSFSAYQALNLPDLSTQPISKKQRKIKIAIIDDGFNLNHELIKPFLSKNPSDIPNNHLDDDQNGFIDDTYGWNVSDNGNDIAIIEGLEKDFFHGTMVASIVSTVFLESYDSLAPDFLELVLIKAVSNKESATTYIKDGYKGIAYAMACNVDVICCAWSGGDLTFSEKELLNKAASNGITIIGSAGNHFKKVLNPAADQNVIAVTSIDSNMILIPSSNYGPEIDFVATGDKVRAGHPLADRAYFYGSGSSASVALISGVYGILLSQFPLSTKTQIIDALKFTSKTVNQFNLRTSGKLGAGIPQVKKALEYISDPRSYSHYFNPLLSEGAIFFNPKDTIQSYTIKPSGPFYGLEFQVDSKSRKKIALEVSTNDSTYLVESNNPNYSKKQLVTGNTLTIKNKSKKNKAQIRVSYQTVSIDSSKLYCKEIKYLYAPKDSLGDGSDKFNYTNGCNCRWVIKAPSNKKIKLQVNNMDTQPNVDFLWVFNGKKSLEENLMAKFSGHTIPPIITSSSNEVLLWFLTDDTVTGKGWSVNYSWVD
jgi:serine protease